MAYRSINHKENREWEELLSNLDINDVPPEYVKKATVQSFDGKTFEISGGDLSALFHGDYEKLDQQGSEALEKLKEHGLVEMDIMIDFEKFKDHVEKETENVLNQMLKR